VQRAAKRFAAAIGIALVLFAIVVRVSRPSKNGPGPIARATGGEATPTATPIPAGKGRPAIVFFVDAEGQGLVARRTEVTPIADPSMQAKAILDAMVAGPAAMPPAKPGELVSESLPSIPAGTVVRAVFFDGKGTAIVDLVGLAERLGGGSDSEVLALWAVVDALAFNFPVDARRVRVLLDGREAESLGHVSLATPLSPRRDLVIGEVPSLAIPIANGQSEPIEEDDGPSPFDDLVPMAP